MGAYSRTSLELLFAQIQKDNPDAPLFTPETAVLLTGPLTTNLGTSGRNTRIRINGKSGAGFYGKEDFFYDRLDIGKLFSTLPPSLVVNIPQEITTYGGLVTIINDVFGLGLSVSEVKNPTKALPTAYTPTNISLELNSATALAFTGTLVFKGKREASGTYEDSGPGSKQMLIGTPECGYFGTVSKEDMLTATEFFNVAFETGTPGAAYAETASDLVWLKFALNGKYLFFPSRPIVYNISWADIYKLGAVYGDDTNGAYPPGAVTPTPQSALSFCDADGTTYAFRMRLPRFSGADPQAAVRGDPASEAVLLFNKLHAGLYGTSEWGTLPNTASGMDLTMPFWWINSLTGDTTKSHYTQANTASLAQQLKTATGYWRPMLELVESSRVLATRELIPTPTSAAIPVRLIKTTPQVDSVTIRKISGLQGTANTVTTPVRAVKTLPVADVNILMRTKGMLGTTGFALYAVRTIKTEAVVADVLKRTTSMNTVAAAPRAPLVTITYEV